MIVIRPTDERYCQEGKDKRLKGRFEREKNSELSIWKAEKWGIMKIL